MSPTLSLKLKKSSHTPQSSVSSSTKLRLFKKEAACQSPSTLPVAMDMGLEVSSSSPSSSSVSSSPEHAARRASPAKRPAGRTKFRETRHPVYRGVRRRRNTERWVCEVRVPGKRGARLWLGTYATAEVAARANDAAMLALGGRSAACLNFADSAWLLAVPSALSDLADVRRAAVEAVADFQRREAADGSLAIAVAKEASSGAPSLSPSSGSDSAGSTGTSEPSANGVFEGPVVMDSEMFRLDLFPEMDLGSYYMSLAEALLMDPPPTATIIHAYEDNGDGGADVRLWSYSVDM
uniref:C-repeat binding factor 3-like protein n=1 Tax=Hordeum vulgare subsp. spontaneum TaxID=77009 RepID=Q5D672_HORVS|nr:C-repeat binding factor 3-like protein [Hordeum vulgare subsp. spontaneum]AAX14165.1 C-repeat binding factor 3-like protein [Hordeum vulgare subsp. spontaneum]ABO20911.1 C-repeat binding factor 3-like protein [Hordeum vulgare subsp. spontaneum]